MDIEVPTRISSMGVAIDEETGISEVCVGSQRSVQVEDGGATIVFMSERDAVFKILNGREIIVDPNSIDREEEIVLNLLGPLLRFLLLQRGEFVLHASVVRIGSRTAMFIAPSEHGKSTMAAGLYDRGHDILSDDTGIVRSEAGPSVLSGPSVLRLYDESVDRINRNVEPVFSDGLESDKRFYHLVDNQVPNEASLDVVYFIEEGDLIEIEPISARDATIGFVNNSWGLPDEDDEVIAENLHQSSTLAETVTVKRLRYPRSFEMFDDVLTHIEEDCIEH